MYVPFLHPVGQLTTGTQLYEGRYRIEMLLDMAPNRAVYRVWDTVYQRPATMLELASTDPSRAALALERALPLVQLTHNAISPIQVVFVQQSQFFIALSLPGGQLLSHILNERTELFAPASAIRWIAQAVEALDFMALELPTWHLGDLTPSSMLVTSEDRIQIVGFELPLGLIEPRDLPAILAPQAVAPELYENRCDARTDVYALAATLYQLLTGAVWKPAESYPVATLRSDIPPTLSLTITRGLAADPADRWADAMTFYQELLRALVDTPRTTESWFASKSTIADLAEDPPTLTIDRDQLRAAFAAEAARQADAMLGPISGSTFIAPDVLVDDDPYQASFILPDEQTLSTRRWRAGVASIALRLHDAPLPLLAPPVPPIEGLAPFFEETSPLFEIATPEVMLRRSQPLAQIDPVPLTGQEPAPVIYPAAIVGLPTSFDLLDHIHEPLPEPMPWITGHEQTPTPEFVSVPEIAEYAPEPEATAFPAWLGPSQPEPRDSLPPPPRVSNNRNNLLYRLRGILLNPHSNVTPSVGTIVVPREMRAGQAAHVLIRIHCRPFHADEQPITSTILEIACDGNAFYVPASRLAMRIPIEGGVTEGTLTLSPRRPTPPQQVDRFTFTFRGPHDTILHQGQFVAEVTVIDPNQIGNEQTYLTLVQPLDLTKSTETLE